MRVRCVANELTALEVSDQHRAYLATWFGRGNETRVWDNVTIGQVSIVYAIHVYNGFPFCFVRTKYQRDWAFIPSACFEIVDPRASRYWSFAVRPSTRGDGLVVVKLAPNEFLDVGFLERLVDNSSNEVAMMTEIAGRMDAEFT